MTDAETPAPDHRNAAHPFERCDLGTAPFRVVGSFVSKFQAIPGAPDCPIKPGSSCDYCGQGIMLVYVIRGADGREFKVGSDCVRRAADPKLIKIVDRLEREAAATKRAEKAGQVCSALDILLAEPFVRALLAETPHPTAYRAERGETMLDQAIWLRAKAGAAGRAKLLKAIGAIVKAAKT